MLKKTIICLSLLMLNTLPANAIDRVLVSEENYARLFGYETMAEAKNDLELAETMKRFIYKFHI